VKRLLVLAPAPTSAASTRFRLEQYFPALRAAGIEPLLRPFLDEDGFSLLYRRGHRTGKAAAATRALGRRLRDVVDAAGADAVLIHREALLVGPPIIEWLIGRALRCPILFDLDDAVWVPYASPTYGAMLSRLLKAPAKTYFNLRVARHVIAGNAYIADFARQYNPRVDIVPTVVDTDLYRPAPRPRREVPVVGWIGTHSSAQYLRAIVPALQELARRRRFVLRVIGAELEAPGVPLEIVPWSLAREVADFQELDIGLYPLVEDPWSVGKSGFKAVQYMACGVATVASAVGVTKEMIRDGENGLLVGQDPQEWVTALTRLIDDEGLHRRVVDAGRRDAVARWSVAAHASRLVEIVADALRPQQGPRGVECTYSG
jgi:glycosyltransferase involved in cell wall biosynthesis